MYVHELMTRTPVTVTGETHVKKAVDLLVHHQVSLLPVVDGSGRVCGVVSEIDLIRDAITPDPRSHLIPLEDDEPRAVLVSEVMSSPARAVHETADLAEVVQLMSTAQLKSLPVIDEDNHVVGVISRSDIVRVRSRDDHELARNVESVLQDLGHGDWLVEVQEGGVYIQGPVTANDRSIAELVGHTVVGVVSVKVHTP